MPKNTARKRREAGQAEINEVSGQLAADRRQAKNFLMGLLEGGAAAALCLVFMKIGAYELWTPFQNNGWRITGSLLIAGTIAGFMVGYVSRGYKGPMPAAACALGWALYGLSLHVSAPGQFAAFMEKATGIESHIGSRAIDTFFINAGWHPLSLGLGFLAACFAGWLVNVYAQPKAQSNEVVNVPTANTLARSLSCPLILAVLALAGLWSLGRIPLGSSQVWNPELPVVVSHAVLADVITMAAFGIAAYAVAGWFKTSSQWGYVVAAPALTMFIGTVAQSSDRALFLPVIAILWNSSPIEMACWGTFGSIAGYWVKAVNSQA